MSDSEPRDLGEASAGSDESWVGGVHAVTELLESAPDRVLEVRSARRADDRAVFGLIRAAKRAGIKVRRSRRPELDALLPGISHQGVAALRSSIGYASLDEVLASSPRVIVTLDEVTDPRNLGAVLRSAWAFDVGAVLVPRHRAAGLTSAAIKTAAGAAERVPVCRVGNLSRTLARLKESGYWVFGASPEGEQPLSKLDFSAPIVFVLGAEGRGLRRSIAAACDVLFRIPMVAEAGSLNVSVAAGIILAEAFRTRD